VGALLPSGDFEAISKGLELLIPLTIRNKFRRLLEPPARVLIATKVSPSTITLIGIIPAVASGIAFGKGSVRLGGVLMGVSGLFDLADGLVARLGSKESKFGAFLDSTVDRYSEIAIFIGLAVLFRQDATLYGVLLAIAGSMMVSYTKARAEGLGVACPGGMLQRPERMVIVIVGALIGARALVWAVWLVAVLANATAVERLLRTRSAMRGSE
jgi:CDP-diacylglycerol--glycerol-3-phosphate 3-phosphatidyltransferase